MTESFEKLHRFGLKIFFDPIREIETGIFIPVFHRWIQEKAVETLLIDVADYRHVQDGPSILLAGYEANYAIDVSEGRPGLCYYRKQPSSGSLSTKLTLATRALLKAARLLETDADVGAACKFRYDEICFFPNDRLVAPTTADTSQKLVTEIEGFRHLLFGENNTSIDQAKKVAPTINMKERIFFSIKGERGATAKDLIKNVS